MENYDRSSIYGRAASSSREINLLLHRSMVVPSGIMVLRTRDI